MTTRLAGLLPALLAGAIAPAAAGLIDDQGDIVLYVDEPTAFESAVPADHTLEWIQTDAEHVAMATEVTDPPAQGAALGPVLTFERAATGLSVGFTLEALNPWVGAPEYSLVYEDTEFGGDIYLETLSIGDANGVGSDGRAESENDDFAITTFDAVAPVYGIAFVLRNSGPEPGERVLVTGVGGEEAEFDVSSVALVEDQLMAVLADWPIASVTFDEAEGGDDILVHTFGFVTGCDPLVDQGPSGVPAVVAAGLDLADFDGDGDLDLAISGSAGTPLAGIYRNHGGTFTEHQSFTGAVAGVVRWGDVDDDGDPDLLVSGHSGAGGTSRTSLYENIGGEVFVETTSNLAPLWMSDARWADLDNDGDQDLVIAGWAPSGAYRTLVYRNDGDHVFTDVDAGLVGLTEAALDVADYDGDGDLDIACTGQATTNHFAAIYRNDGDFTFVDVNAGLVGVTGDLAWGDPDADGDMDLLVVGHEGPQATQKLYRNDGNDTFVAIDFTESALAYSTCTWADHDNDGDLDATFSGYLLDDFETRHLENLGDGTLVNVLSDLPAVRSGQIAWADVDGDDILDAVVVGGTPTEVPTATVVAGRCHVPRTAPSVPTGLIAYEDDGVGVFRWDPSTDAETPSEGLSYNLFLGTSSGSGDMMYPLADRSTGVLEVARGGNVGQSVQWRVALPPDVDVFYWSVQAIDGTFIGSAFADEAVFDRTILDGGDQAPAVTPTAMRIGAMPNPFRASTELQIAVARTASTTVEIFDSAGRHMRTLLDRSMEPGRYAVTWDGVDNEGRLLPAGVYLARVRSGSEMSTERLILVR